MTEFSNKLKELRTAAGLSQAQLAEKLGVSKATVSYYEKSERDPSPELLIKIAGYFHITTDYLLGLNVKTRYLDVTDLDEESIRLLQHTINVLKSHKA